MITFKEFLESQDKKQSWHNPVGFSAVPSFVCKNPICSHSNNPGDKLCRNCGRQLVNNSNSNDRLGYVSKKI